MLKEGVEKMDLFKERLKIVWCEVVTWLLFYILPLTVFILIIWLISLSKSLSDFFAWAVLSVLGLAFLSMIFYGIYWLFVEPFRKK